MSSEKATEAKSAQSEMPQRQTEQQMQTEKQKQTEQKREEGLESESASKKNPEIKQESEEQKNPETKKDLGSQENLESQRKQESKENTVQGSSDQTEKVMDSMKISQTERQNRKVSGEEETEKNPKVKKQSAKNEARAASDSIYLTVRSSAVTLDKASGVKVGNVKTQLPDGYEGYIRRTAKCETNLGSDVFTAEGGPLDGREDCKTLTAKDKNKYYAWYRKGMYYQGKWVDIKVTLVDFELRDGAFFRFVTDRPGIETCKVEWAETKMEFFRSDNGNAIDVKGYITFQDIDLYQGILMKNGFGNVYVKRAALENLKAATVKGKNYYFDTSGLNQSGSDTGFMLSVLISGKAATAVFTFVRPENNLGTSTTPSGGLVAKAYKMFPNAHPHIEKYVSDSDEKMTSENRLSTREETYTYTLRTMVPIENEETCYHDLSISDQLDDFLEIKNVTVTNENGANAEKFWTIQKTNAFVARCSDIKNTSFYGHTYDFQITVGVKKDAGLEKRWDPAKKMARIKNQASASSDGNTVRSQTVVTNIAPVKSSVSVEKRDGKTKEKLPGAVFAVYEWNGSRYAATPLFQLKNEADGVYESAEILSYTDENKGKFKIIEEQSPEGYTKSGWEKEFVISPFESKKITYHGDNACFNEPLWITVQIQKKDLETGKALSGARFAVYEWNQEQQNYVPYAAWPELVTAINGEAVSGKLYYQKKNEGKFRLQETQPPKNYFGDYVDGEKEKGLKFYDFRVTAQNAGQSLELTNNGKQTGFVNTPQMASIAVKKIGEVLTEARDSADGVIFLYEKQPLAGAKYEITAAEDIYKADGVTLALKKGAVAQQLVTGKDGTAVSRKLYLGRYHVTETEAPQGYVRKDTVAGNTRTVTLSYRGPEIREYVSEEQVFENERPKMQVTVFKRSENTQKGLAGARFGLYAGENILSDGNRIAAKDTLLALAYSKKDGSCLFDADVPCGYRYYVKEIQAPEHYYKQVKKARYEFQWIYQDDKTQLYTFPKPGSESEAVFLNQEVTAEVTVQKVDAQSGLSRPQQMASLKGAVYGIYAKEAITSADGDGEILYEKNAEVMRKETDTEGRLCFTGLPLGTYYVKEIKASEGYLADAAVYTVDCAYEGQDILVIKKEVFSKERIKSQPFTCFKLTGDNKETDLEWMRGAGFSVYSVKELEEKGHLKKGSAQLEDAVLIQEVIDQYRDKDTLQYQKMKALETAAYYDEAGKMQRLKEQFSDENGVLNIRALPYGKYLLVETTVPEGKVAAAPKVLNVDSDEKDGLVDGDGKGTLQMGSAIWDQPQTSYLKIVKKDKTTGETVAKPGAKYVIHDVEGAYFNWYMEDKTSEEKVDYINRFGNLVVAYTNGEMLGSYENPYVTAERKDSDGRVLGTYVSTTTTLPQGLYILEEVQAPEGYVRQGAEGRYRKRNGQYFFEVSAKKLPGMEAVHALKITEEAVGTWEQADIASKDYRVRVQIGSDEAKTTYDRLAGAFVTEAVQENEAAVGKLSIYAEGEVLTGYDLKKGFAYTCKPLAGNVFVVRAAEDIFSGEGKGGQTLLFAKGSVVTTLTTDENGKAWTEKIKAAGLEWYGLPLGTYTLEQIKAAKGYALSGENQAARTFEIRYAGQEVPIRYQSELYEIPRQRAQIQIEKKDAETKEKLTGAKFGLYAAEDILAADQKSILVKEDTRLAIAETKEAENGIMDAAFDLDLPMAHYYVREEKAPDGYYRSDNTEEISFTAEDDSKNASEDGRSEDNMANRTENDRKSNAKTGTPHDATIKSYVRTFENYKTMLQINIMDYDTETELDGVKYSIVDSKGEIVQEAVSIHGNNVLIRGLKVGETYQIRETKAREGYNWQILEKEGYKSPHVKEGYEQGNRFFEGIASKVFRCQENQAEIRLEDKECVQVVSLFNRSISGKLEIRKEGEVPEAEIKDQKLQKIVYETKGLKGAEYDLVAAETIPHPDGYSKDLYLMGTTIAHVITDEQGKAVLSDLPLGRYEIRETKAPSGYTRKQKDAKRNTELLWKDSADLEITATETFFNERQKIDIGQEPDGPEVSPTVPEEPGTIIGEEWKGRTGVFKKCVDGEKENRPEGAEFTLYAKKDITDANGSVVLPAGTEIERAISDQSGRAVFQTDLPPGTYAVKETKAPDGYYRSDTERIFDFEPYKDQDHIFIIRMKSEIENAAVKVRLFLRDDLTKKELAGAKLQILDEDGKILHAVSTENTEGKGCLILGLNPEKTYRIVEVLPRKGYKKEILIPDSMKDILKQEQKQEVTFSVSQQYTEEMMEQMPEEVVFNLENAFMTGKVKISKTGEILNEVSRKLGIVQGLWNQIKTWFGYQTGSVKGVSFTVKAKEDLYHPDGVTGLICKAGEVVPYLVRSQKTAKAEGDTDQDGSLVFEQMYLGTYELEEINIPEGYQKKKDKVSFVLAETSDGSEADVTEAEVPVYNERQKVEIRVTKCDKENPQKMLEGAVFGLYAAEDIKTAKGEVLLEKGTLLETQKSDKEGNLLFVSDLPLGKYEVREIAAPDGYIRTAQTEEIDASWKEEGMAVQKFQVIFENQITKVFVKKTASDTKELLEGAKLAIYQGNTCIESWITEKEEHCVEGLEVGKTYTLRELSPAPGYATAAEQVFQMEDHKEEDGTYQGQKLEMQDPPTEVHITVFEKDGDKKVPLGNVKAHLETPQGETLLKENSPMERDGIWESGTEQAEIFKKVAIGHYKIVVDEIPKGYVHPDVTDIEVKDTAEVQKFEVLVEPICIRITGYALSSAAEKKQTRTIRSGIYVHIRDLFEERSLELPEAYTRVPSGSYQVKTDRVPDGYVLPAQTKITVREDTSEIQDFEVEIRPTVIKIEAVDKKTQTPLEGVKISVVNEKGKKIWKHVTLTALKEKVIPSWYTIQVEKVPKGYQKPKNQKIKVKAVANVQKYKVELTKEAQVQTEKRVDTENFDKTTGNDHSGFSSDNTPDNENAVTAAKTGDASWMEMWIFAGLMAASSMILWFFRKKRHIR